MVIIVILIGIGGGIYTINTLLKQGNVIQEQKERGIVLTSEADDWQLSLVPALNKDQSNLKEYTFEICQAIEDGYISNPIAIVDPKTLQQIYIEDYNKIFIKYEESQNFDFKVGVLSTSKPRTEITYDDLEEVSSIKGNERIYLALKTDGRLTNEEEVKVTFYDMEGKYKNVTVKVKPYSPHPRIVYPETDTLSYYYSPSKYLFFSISIKGMCGPFLADWEGDVNVKILSNKDLTFELVEFSINGKKIEQSDPMSLNFYLGKKESAFIQWKVNYKEKEIIELPIEVDWGSGKEIKTFKIVFEE